VKAKVIAYTQPVSSDYGSNIEEFIAYVARVSNPSNQWNHETAGKLLKYLEDHKHWSPFEMADIVLEIETTRDIARQLLRHRSFSFQEFSQRYAEVSEFAEPKKARLQDSKNRQNSVDVPDEWEIVEEWEDEQINIIKRIKDTYNWAISQGIAKEVARVILPEGLTKSRLYMKGSIRSWMHYLEVRLDPSTQKEHRELAQEIANAIKEVMNK
jgi:thymidylate synthase (FAD)